VTEDEFWDIVAESRRAAGDDIFEQPGTLADLLVERTPQEVLEFHRQLVAASQRAYTDVLVHAAQLLLGKIGQDSFTDFRTWLICHGRETYERVLADPDAVLDLPFDEDQNDFSAAESFGAMPMEVYEELTEEDFPDDEELLELLDPQPGVEIDSSDDTLRRLMPRLMARADRER
jgi:hypothetical protein